MATELEVFAVREVTVKYKTLKRYPQAVKIANSRDLYQLFRNRMNEERVEVFQVVMLNSKNEFMAIDTIARGSLSASVVHPREVMTNPVRLQAAALILMHNHPSGDPTPSSEDHGCTQRLVAAGKILGIRILDHIIFGHCDYYSFANSGTLQPEASADAKEQAND
jgi:DNA repair protein RadC